MSDPAWPEPSDELKSLHEENDRRWMEVTNMLGQSVAPAPKAVTPQPGVYRYDAVSCPACGKRHDAAANVKPGDGAVQDGDYSVCVGCGVMSIFVIGPLGVAFRAPDADEVAQFIALYGSVVSDPRQYLT